MTSQIKTPLSAYPPGQLLTDPVIAPDGFIYNLAEIAQYVTKEAKSPVTNEKMGLMFIRPMYLIQILSLKQEPGLVTQSELRRFAPDYVQEDTKRYEKQWKRSSDMDYMDNRRSRRPGDYCERIAM